VSLPVVFRRAARAEFDDAADWYEARRPGLGAAFTAAVQRVLDRIAAQPDFYAAVWNGVREALVPGFPYCVYYREEPGQVLVLSVFHTARDPSIWQSRA
jgi:plasmid stabilization system protein ParE